MSRRKKDSHSSLPNLGRHQAGCKVCSHPRCDEIEKYFISWVSPEKITKQFKLGHRASVYRHAHALDLFSKRSRNLRAALEHIIEKAVEVPVNASAVVQAIIAYGKINSQGQLVDRQEVIDVNKLFDQMNPEELHAYARTGELPTWFKAAVGATIENSREEKDDE